MAPPKPFPVGRAYIYIKRTKVSPTGGDLEGAYETGNKSSDS